MAARYLDFAASNPVDPRVAEAVARELELVGNPSSVHASGRRAREAVDSARASVARLLGVGQSEVVFTSGATESAFLAVFGYLRRLRGEVGPDRPLHLLVSEIEHPSVLRATEIAADAFGAELETVAVGRGGAVNPESVRSALRPETALVAVMWANNVLGTLQPVEAIAAAVVEERERRGPDGLPLAFMSDAVQAFRTESVRPADVGVDILALSGHKMYGPKGVGALYVRRGVELAPPNVGGGQESGFRGGTENLPGIVGLGMAAELLAAERGSDREATVELDRRLREGIESVSGVKAAFGPDMTVPGIVYLTVPESGDVLVLKLDAAGVEVSSGSACEAGKRRTSGVLSKFGENGLRVSFGRGTSEGDIDEFLAALAAVVRR